MRHALVRSAVALLGMAMLLVAQGPQSPANAQRPTKAPASPGNLTDIELMTIYGAIVRANYAAGTNIGETSPNFLALEQEIERRKLLTAKSLEEIQRGIMYLDMPLYQAFAVIDGLKLVENVPFDRFRLWLYRAPPVRWESVSSSNRYTFKPTVLVCNEKIIGFMVSGIMAFEARRAMFDAKRRAQTNFPPGFFDQRSRHAMRFLREGLNAPKERDRMVFATQGLRGYILFEVAGLETPRKDYVSLAKFVDREIQGRRYRSLAQYLEKSC